MSIPQKEAPQMSIPSESPGGADTPPVEQPLVAVEDLRVDFATKRGAVHAVDGVSFEIGHGETVGLVGETGCGKSVTARSFLRLVPSPPARYPTGRILFRPRQGWCSRCQGVGCPRCAAAGEETIDLLQVPDRTMRAIRGERVAMIFQDPALALNPVLTIGEQVCEVFYQHRSEELLAEAGLTDSGFLLGRAAHQQSTGLERAMLRVPPLRRRHHRLRAAARERAAAALKETRIGNPYKILDSYPHELSGGLKQRVMIAQALACAPDLLIADEPTTALDTTIQARILDLIRELQERHHTAVLYISHDLSLVRDVCDRLMVMYAGQLVEEGPTARVFHGPLHPYTRGLLAAIPSGGQARGSLMAIPGSVPELVDATSECRFHTRCPHAGRLCGVQAPALNLHGPPDQRAACFLHDDAEALGAAAEDMPSEVVSIEGVAPEAVPTEAGPAEDLPRQKRSTP